VWRQGVKHDAADVMELTEDPGGALRNKRGEPVDVERSHVFPLLKGTDLIRSDPPVPRQRVIVTQRKVGDDTSRLGHEAPRLWEYLKRHEERFEARRSSVYKGRPPFAMFGVGPYCFARDKVAVSGLHRSPVFRVIGSGSDEAPVMLDDTCYFLPCGSAEQAALVAALMNAPASLGLLTALACPGAKRPVTKALLQRVDLHAVVERSDPDALLARATSDVARLTGRAPEWPEDLTSLLAAGPQTWDHPQGGPPARSRARQVSSRGAGSEP
jgi:hypothetical protein